MKVREPVEVLGTGKIPGRSVRARAFRAVAVVMHGAENLPRSVKTISPRFLASAPPRKFRHLEKRQTDTPSESRDP